MRNRLFVTALLLLALAAAWIYLKQGASIIEARVRLGRNEAERASENARVPTDAAAPDSGPSLELLRLRGEVAILRRELENRRAPDLASNARSNDLQLIYSDPRPSEHLDFVDYSNIAPAGFATPEAAFQSFNQMMMAKQPLTNTQMKDYWNVPDDYDQPPGYNIHLGEGFYGGKGYRVVSRRLLGTNTVELTVDFEKNDGTSFRRDRLLVEHNGHWRLQPVSVTRAQ
jgi:hypothetical protein